MTGNELPIDPVPAIEEQLRLAKIARAEAVAADIAADNAEVFLPVLQAIMPRLTPHPDLGAMSNTLTRIRTLCREVRFDPKFDNDGALVNWEFEHTHLIDRILAVMGGEAS